MKGSFNLRRFLAFTPISIGLALLTVYGRDVMPPLLVGAIVIFLFTALFLIFYSSPRWKPTLPPISTPRLLLLFAVVAIAFVVIAWIERRLPQVLPWLVGLLIFGSLAFYSRGRNAAK
jgi:hypothetical protein